MRLLLTGVTKVGLLGTQFTMGEAFYKDRVSEKYGIEVIVPEKSQQEIVHNIIYAELIMGEIKDESRQRYLEVYRAVAGPRCASSDSRAALK